MAIDSFFNSPPSLEADHFAIHNGIHYTLVDLDSDVDIAAPKYYLLEPDSNAEEEIHLVIGATLSGKATIEFFEEDAIMNITDPGTKLTERNNYREHSSKDGNSKLNVYKDPTVVADGSTRLLITTIGSAGTHPVQNPGEGGSQRSNEFILDKNKKYIVKCTVVANDTEVLTSFSFYEKKHSFDIG